MREFAIRRPTRRITQDTAFGGMRREFQHAEYTLTCRLRASSTRSAWRMRTQRHSSPGEIPRTSHQEKKHHPIGWLKLYGNLLRLTSFPRGRTEQCCEPSDIRRRVRFLVRVTRTKKHHPIGWCRSGDSYGNRTHVFSVRG